MVEFKQPLTSTSSATDTVAVLCVVQEVDLTNLIASVIDQVGTKRKVSLKALPGKPVDYPAVGERWVISREYGDWMFVASVGVTPTFSGLTNATPAATPNTVMSRDGSGRSSVVDPLAPANVATKNYVDTLAPNRFIDGGTKTAAFNAAAGTMYSINLGASLGTVTAQLPTAPAQGTCIAFARIDTNSYTSFASIAAGGGDTMDGGAPFVLSAGNTILIYQGTRWNVLAYGTGGFGSKIGVSASTSFPPNIMARDGSGNSEINAPTSGLHIANKTYVDGNIRFVSGNTSANNRDIILVNAAGGAITITVPIAAGNNVMVKKTDTTTNTVTVVGASGTVDTLSSYVISSPQASAVFIGDGTNLQIEGYADGPGGWTSYTPILKSFSSGLTVSATGVTGRYKVMGKTIFVQGELTASALAAQATVSLPIAGARRFLNCGSMVCFGTTTPADQSYCARMLDVNANALILVGTTGGFRDCASGNSLDWSVTYELP